MNYKSKGFWYYQQRLEDFRKKQKLQPEKTEKEDFKEKPKPLTEKEELLEVLEFISGKSKGSFPNYRFEVISFFRHMFLEGLSNFKIQDTVKEMKSFFEIETKKTLRDNEVKKYTNVLKILSSYPNWDLKDLKNTTSKTPRISIPQNIKDKVWNRDGGKCVQCGSNENIEFDHIIPFSKGGSSTYRNLQILCEKCNRSKSSKIG